MLEHLALSHREEQVPNFRFRVVKKCRTALERQVREAVRIEMRGNILNKKGMFNRCKLTRMVVDSEWEKEVWEEAWEPRPGNEVDEDTLRATSKSKSRQEESSIEAKRARKEEGGSSWGEELTEEDSNRAEFLQGESSQPSGKIQIKVKVFTGLEWMMREILKEVAHAVIDMSTLTEGADLWEEWIDNNSSPSLQSKGTEDPPQLPVRSRKEERQLWAILAELDKQVHQKEQKEQAKKLRGIARARKKMGADKHQPSIFEVMPQPMPGVMPQPFPPQVKPTVQVEHSDSPAHPISHHQESSEAFARIGLVSEEVGPKKLKTGENQQPRPAVEPILGVVRGEGGVFKTSIEGGGCVNTQTGSVSVAASQSNNVMPGASLVESTGAMPQPPQALRAMPQPIQVHEREVRDLKSGKAVVIMGGPSHHYGVGAPPHQINTRACGHTSQKNENESVMPMKNECAMSVKNECKKNVSLPDNLLVNVEIRSEDPHSVSKNKNSEDRPKLKVKYRVNNTSNGKFNLTPANGSPVSRKLENIHQKSSSVQTGLEFFRNLENSVKNSTESNSILHTTPGKRKLVPDVVGERTPVSISDRLVSDVTRRENILLESPAKKQRSCRHGGQNI